MFTVASFFSGVGGIDLGFSQTGKCKTVYANEFDSYAAVCEIMKLNEKKVLM